MKKKSEWKKEERKKEKKKRGYIKKGSKKGSESEPASSTHIKGCLVCTPLSCGTILQQKNVSPHGSTQPCSRMLANPCQKSHPLLALHSVTSSPNARKEEECSSYNLELCYSTQFGTCSYAKKGDILCTSNPKALWQQIMPPRSMVSTH